MSDTSNQVTNAIDPVYQALIRDDPTAGLVTYVQSIKPYHTKILDVFVEYVFEEKVAVSVFDNACWDLEIGPDAIPGDQSQFEYQCGYGILWNPVQPALALRIKEASIDQASSVNAKDPTMFINSFSVENEPHPLYSFKVVNGEAGLCEFTETMIPVTKNTISNLTVSGNLTPAFGNDQVINVVTDGGAVASHTVTGVSLDTTSGDTTITVTPQIIGTIKQVGIIAPLWWPFTAIRTTADQGLPPTLSTSSEYYIVPCEQVNQFRLSTKRLTKSEADIVKPLSVPIGWIGQVRKNAVLFDGASVVVSGSAGRKNDGFTIPIIRTSSPASSLTVGTATFPAQPGDLIKIVDDDTLGGKYQITDIIRDDINKVTTVKVFPKMPATTRAKGTVLLEYQYTVYRTYPDPDRANHTRVCVMQSVPRATSGISPVPYFDGLMYYTQYGGYDSPSVCFPIKAPSLDVAGFFSERLEITHDDGSGDTITIMALQRPID